MLNGNEILRTVDGNKNYLLRELRIHKREIFNQWNARIQNRDPIKEETFANELIEDLEKSVSVYWEENIRRAAEQGSEFFIGKKLSAISPSPQLWICEESESKTKNTVIRPNIDLSEQEAAYLGVKILGVIAELLITESFGTYIFQFLEPTCDDIPAWRAQNLPPFILCGSLLRAEDQITTESFSQVEACLNFIQQPFIESNSLDHVANFTGAHHIQKRNDAKKIQIVYLRRREQHTGNAMIDAQGTKIDWSCQWLVKGHWRNQYLPSNQGHKPIFIQSYVKGPEDKPFRTSPQRIHAVVR